MPGPQYGMARQGKIEVVIDENLTNEIDLLTAPQEVLVANDLKPGPHRALIRFGQIDQGWVSIDAFRAGNFPFGSMEFDVFGDDSYSLNDVRVKLEQDNKVVLCRLERNAFTGKCLITGLKPGSYDLSIRAMGWKPIARQGVSINMPGQTVHPGSFYLQREERARGSNDGVLSPNRGRTVFVKPGNMFEIHCEAGENAKVRSATLVTDHLKIPLEITDPEVYRYNYENTVRVKLPKALPADLYDLEVKFVYPDGEWSWEDVAPQAVRVYQDFPGEYYLVTLGHTDTWGQQASEWLRELADIINLIHP